jgi:hypothetical protein
MQRLFIDYYSPSALSKTKTQDDTNIFTSAFLKVGFKPLDDDIRSPFNARQNSYKDAL